MWMSYYHITKSLLKNTSQQLWIGKAHILVDQFIVQMLERLIQKM